MRNKYAGDCVRCGISVPAGAGHFEKTEPGVHIGARTKWVVRCKDCVGKGHLHGTTKEVQG